jgi:hypothetical protein
MPRRVQPLTFIHSSLRVWENTGKPWSFPVRQVSSMRSRLCHPHS